MQLHRTAAAWPLSAAAAQHLSPRVRGPDLAAAGYARRGCASLHPQEHRRDSSRRRVALTGGSWTLWWHEPKTEVAAQKPLVRSQKQGEAVCGTQPGLQVLPVTGKRGSRVHRYVYDGHRVRLVSDALLDAQLTTAGLVAAWIRNARDVLVTAFFPLRDEVTPDYWTWLRWRMTQRFFSSTMHNFATQSLLIAAGVGAQRALAASAMLNWMLKDGVNRVARMVAGTSFAKSFDSDLKRFRFVTSLALTLCMACEFLAPHFPHHFLLLASVANVGKAVGLTTYLSTSPAFTQSFCRTDNFADVTAKTQAQHMVIDTLALALSAWLTHMFASSARWQLALLLVVYPVCAVGDMVAIYHELKAIQLRTINRERAEMIAEAWLSTRTVPSSAQVSKRERLLGRPNVCGGFLPLRIAPLEVVAETPAALMRMLQQYGDSKYMLHYTTRPQGWLSMPAPQLLLALSEGAGPRDILQAILEVAYVRDAYRYNVAHVLADKHVVGSASDMSACNRALLTGAVEDAKLEEIRADCHQLARQQAAGFVDQVAAAGWRVDNFLLSSQEKHRYCYNAHEDKAHTSGSVSDLHCY